MKIIFRALAVISFFIFGVLLASVILALYQGTAETLVLFLKMFFHPDVVIDNIEGAVSIAAKALTQIAIIYVFFALGRLFWRKSRVVVESRASPEGIDSTTER